MKLENTQKYDTITSIHKSVKNISLPRKVKRKLDEKQHIDDKSTYPSSQEEGHVDKYV